MTREEGMLIELIDKVKKRDKGYAISTLREEVEQLKKESYGTKATSSRAKKQAN